MESCGFTQVVVGNSWFLSSNYGDGSEPLVVSQGCQISYLIARDSLGFFLSCDMDIGMQIETEIPASVSYCDSDLVVCIDFPG